jgi:hypothetical protein
VARINQSDEPTDPGGQPSNGEAAENDSAHTSAGGGRRGRAPRAPEPRAFIKRVANQAREMGWEAPEDFHIVRFYGDAAWMLYVELAAWTARASGGPTRGERRLARRLAFWIAATLRDMKQEQGRIDAVASGETTLLLPSGLYDIPAIEPDAGALAYRVGMYRFLMALGAERLKTQRRALVLIRAVDRLGVRMEQLGILPPIARVRAEASRPRATPASDARADAGREGSSVPERERDKDENERGRGESEHRADGASERAGAPTREGVRKLRIKDWEREGWGG